MDRRSYPMLSIPVVPTPRYPRKPLPAGVTSVPVELPADALNVPVELAADALSVPVALPAELANVPAALPADALSIPVALAADGKPRRRRLPRRLTRRVLR